ncbi:MAG: hypothetical protein ABL958_12495 [Bdellovibrionia bacterium]
MVSLRTHNILDYIGAAVLVLAPYLFGFNDILVARNVFLGSGFALALYSLCTNYEFSIVKWIPVGVHMTLDVIVGLFVMVAPGIFDYGVFLSDWQYALHFVLGIGVLGLVAFTNRKGIRASVSDIGTPFRTDVEDTRRDRIAFP